MTRNLTQVAGSFIGTMEEFHASEKNPLVSQIIHITDSQTGKILDTIPLGDFWDDNHHKSLKDTLEYFEFRTFGDKRYSQHLEKMNRLIIPDEDGTFIEFVIFHAIKYRLQNTVVVDVYAPASYLLLKKAKVIKPQRVSEYTASQHLGFALNGTEWRPGIVESDKYRTLDIENHTNPYAYIRRIANEFELEPRFRIETDGNKVIGRYVDLLERVGQWQGREVEFGRDLIGIERKVDDSNVVTALIGLGPERDDGTRLEVFVEDEEALQRWGTPNPQTGELMHLIETYEPESTDQDMTVERLTELTRNELEKRINSVVEYTADVADLEKVPGMENKVIRFGDTIKIKDTGFNPPLYLEARVHTQDRSLSQPEKKKVTLGDYIEYTEEEVHAIWKQLQAEIAKKISMADVLEVTYTKEEIDEKDIPGKEAKAKIDRDVGEAIIETTDGSQDKADQAERNAKNHADSVANQARQEAITEAVSQAQQALNNAVNELETSIAEKADAQWVSGQLQLKADSETVSVIQNMVGELQDTASSLQQAVDNHADQLEEQGGKITKLETDYDKLEGSLNATITELSNLNETVSRHETQIEANAREIALKASQQEFDSLSGTVSDISGQLTVMAGQIEAKAEKSDLQELEGDVSQINTELSSLKVDVEGISTNVSNLSQTVSNHGTQISNINSTLTQHANLIASKVDATTYQQDKNGIITRIESAESRITQTENAIQTKVEQSEFDSVTNTLGNRISTIEQTADSISLEVRDIKANVYTKSEVDSAIGGIQVGGRNLYKSSDNIPIIDVETGITYQKISDGIYENVWKFTKADTSSANFIKINDSNLVNLLEPDKEFTVSILAKGTPRTGFAPILRFYFNSSTSYKNMSPQVGSNYTWVSFTFKTSDVTPAMHIGMRNFKELYIALIKIERGNKATDWTPAPEDIDEKFTDIEGTLASHSTKIEQNAQQIQLRATKAEVDTLYGRVNQAESQITQLAGQIELRATKTEVDALSSRVSTVESTIQQHADMIESKIDAGDARSIFRQEASSFTFEADQINFKGHVFGEDAIFMGSIGTPMLTVGAEDITGHENFGLRLQTAQWQPDANEPFRKTGHIEFNTLNNGLEIIKYNLDNSTGYLDYFEVYARAFRIWGDVYVGGSGWVYTAAIDFPVGYAPGDNIYLRPAHSNAEVRATVTGTIDQYVDMRARTFLAGGTTGNGTFTTESGYVVLRAGDNSSVAYIQSNIEVRATRRMQGDSYVPVRASSFPTGSLEEFKTNIKKWEESALDIIRNADIYEFNLKNDLEVGKDKKRYGLVIGDGYRTPEEVVDEDGIEQYAMNSISWKAIQELDTEQQELRGRIAWLEAENKLLWKKIKKLEGMIS